MNNPFIIKADEKKLVELGQFIRDTRPSLRVEREWHIIFDKNSGKYLRYVKTTQKNPLQVSRNPDLIILDKKTKKLLLVIEIDGEIHRKKEIDTKERNEQYKKANIPIIAVSEWEIETNIFDYINTKLDNFLG